ncbi:hypothetical protein J6590_004209 [Homalodisca vitripennis]|nr:hypothetical protein J6590_004209 [Homalodisca vitripennis]
MHLSGESVRLQSGRRSQARPHTRTDYDYLCGARRGAARRTLYGASVLLPHFGLGARSTAHGYGASVLPQSGPSALGTAQLVTCAIFRSSVYPPHCHCLESNSTNLLHFINIFS